MSGLLDKIQSFDFLKKSEGVLGVDIGSSAIKIVQLKKRGGKISLENYGSLALGPYARVGVGQATNLPKENITEALVDLMNETGVTTKSAAMAIPLRDTMVSLIEMPDVGEKQLEGMVPLEARKHIPVPVSEVTLNFQIMPRVAVNAPASVPAPVTAEGEASPRRGTVDVLIAAIHNNSINKYQDIKEHAGLDLKLFEIEIFSTVRALVGNDMSPLLIIDIGAGTTKLVLVEYGMIMGSHSINRGSQDVTAALSRVLGVDMGRAEEIKRDPGLLDDASRRRFGEIVSLPFAHIFSEANNVLFEYQKKHNKAVNKIILSGGGALVGGVSALAEEYFKTKVAVGDPFSMIDAPAFLRETLKSAGPEFSVAIGLALEAV